MGGHWKEIILGVAVIAAYFGMLLLVRRELGKNKPDPPQYGSKYSEELANSDGFRHRSLSD